VLHNMYATLVTVNDQIKTDKVGGTCSTSVAKRKTFNT
jgi:hypothetical protein